MLRLPVTSTLGVLACALFAVAALAASDGRGSRSNPYPLRTSVRLDNDWKIKVTGVNWNAWPKVHAANEFNDPPKPGRTMVMARIVATYLGSDSDSFSDGDLKAVGRSNVSYDTFDPGCGVLPAELPFKEVFRGGTIAGNICWQVKKTDTASLEMYYDAFLTSKVFFRLH